MVAGFVFLLCKLFAVLENQYWLPEPLILEQTIDQFLPFSSLLSTTFVDFSLNQENYQHNFTTLFSPRAKIEIITAFSLNRLRKNKGFS